MDQYVRCDACGDSFPQKKNSFVEQDGDIETAGLRCPHCDTRYVAYRTNSEVRRLQAKVRKEVVKFRQKIVAGVAPNRAERKLKKAKRELEIAFKALNGGEVV